MAVFAFGFPGIVQSFPPLLSQLLTGDIHTATANRKKKKSPTESPPNLKLLFQFQDEVPPVARLFHLCVTVYAHSFNTPCAGTNGKAAAWALCSAFKKTTDHFASSRTNRPPEQSLTLKTKDETAQTSTFAQCRVLLRSGSP